MKDSLNIAIAGATGYVGLELIKILSNHPKARIVYLCAQKSVGRSISTFDKRIKKNQMEQSKHSFYSTSGWRSAKNCEKDSRQYKINRFISRF